MCEKQQQTCSKYESAQSTWHTKYAVDCAVSIGRALHCVACPAVPHLHWQNWWLLAPAAAILLRQASCRANVLKLLDAQGLTGHTYQAAHSRMMHKAKYQQRVAEKPMELCMVQNMDP
ncbi:hypothetical protein FISHEDRAFT_55025 [Fistulina hepatica ATCC 64428]|uniref:Uncharacterized protein n=1 Tax=Fistulina hepatica ATCC 64428 TaxID=1128425 RepID=A0A0D7AQQ8_9AGAR|nr:hypothetical protein FISHEDRAFT_55025 [Fistulina hepatica ATCC 64428]